MNIIVSSCLLGLDCKFCSTGCYREDVERLTRKYNIIPVCAEQIGGLPSTRPPIKLVNGRAIGTDGKDYTLQFEKGARAVLDLAKNFDCKYAVLKGQATCSGCTKFDDEAETLVNGSNFTAGKLLSAGIVVVNENDLEELL